MIASLFLRVYGTHQQNAGSSLVPLAITNLAASTGCDSFITESLVHDSVLSFHWTRRSHPAMVFINLHWLVLVVMYLSSMLMATDFSFLESTIPSISIKLYPLESTCKCDMFFIPTCFFLIPAFICIMTQLFASKTSDL